HGWVPSQPVVRGTDDPTWQLTWRRTSRSRCAGARPWCSKPRHRVARGAWSSDPRAPGPPPVVVDGNSAIAASPVELLLVAAASCTASDVVLILQKQRGAAGAPRPG